MHTELGYNLDKNQIQLFLAKMIDKGLDHSGAGSDSSGAQKGTGAIGAGPTMIKPFVKNLDTIYLNFNKTKS